MARGLAVLALGLAMACGESAVDPESRPPAGSGPGALPRSLAIVSSPSIRPATGAERAWVALAPGSGPATGQATIRVSDAVDSLLVPVLDGGFDPVPVPATVGDTLVIRVSAPDGSVAAGRAAVPPRSRPRVVRTSPADGVTDVPLNSRIRVVFSEPMSAASLETAVQLLRDSVPLPAEVLPVQVDGETIGVEVAPDSPLVSGAVYHIVIGAEARDLDGETLAAAVRTSFTTTAAASPPPVDPTGTAPPVDTTGTASRRLVLSLSTPGGSAPVELAGFRLQVAPSVEGWDGLDYVVEAVAGPGGGVFPRAVCGGLTRSAGPNFGPIDAECKPKLSRLSVGRWQFRARMRVDPDPVVLQSAPLEVTLVGSNHGDLLSADFRLMQLDPSAGFGEGWTPYLRVSPLEAGRRLQWVGFAMEGHSSYSWCITPPVEITTQRDLFPISHHGDLLLVFGGFPRPVAIGDYVTASITLLDEAGAYHVQTLVGPVVPGPLPVEGTLGPSGLAKCGASTGGSPGR